MFLQQTFNNTKVYGVDIQKWKVWEKIKQEYPIKFSEYDGRFLEFDNESFEVIVSFGVLEHVEEFGGDEKLFLKEVRLKLIPGGIFCIFNLPNKWSYKEIIAEKIGFNFHKRRFTKNEITNLLRTTGFEILYCKRFGVLPAGGGKMITFSPILNLFTKIEKTMPELPFSQCFDIIARRGFH